MKSNIIASSTALTGVEHRTLARCERIIGKGIDTFREVGEALLKIRSARLYRRTAETFADYCKERWGFNDSRARQLIAAAKTAATVEISTVLNEGQAKELTRVPTDQRQAVLDHAKEESDGKPLTAAVIREAADEVLKAKPDDKEDDDEPITCKSESVEKVGPVLELDNQTIRQQAAERNNAVFYIRQILVGGKWVSSSEMFKALSRPEMRVRAFYYESPLLVEQERRYSRIKNTIGLDMASTQGDQIIRTTLHAMVWLGIVEVRVTGNRVEYRHTPLAITDDHTEAAQRVAGRQTKPKTKRKKKKQPPELIESILSDIKVLKEDVAQSPKGTSVQKERALSDLRDCSRRVREACHFLV